jgi:hypothetical protein
MTHINQRRDTAANWTSTNPVLQLGEVGWETDTRKSKLGDGATAWNDLGYTLSAIAATKADVGLGQVDNTSDMDKPVSSAQGVAIASAVAPKANTSDVAAALALKAPLDSPALTGNPTAPTPATADNDTSIATTAFVKAQAYAPLASPVLTGDPKAPTPSVGDNDTSIATTAFVKSLRLSAVRLADKTIVSSSVLQADEYLFLSLEANARYFIDGALIYTGQTFAAGPGDFKVDWTIPAGAAMRWSRGGYASNAPTAPDLVVTDNAAIRPLGTFGPGTDVGALFKGWITTGATAGTLQMRWAQNASTAVGTTLRAGSWVRAERFA